MKPVRHRIAKKSLSALWTALLVAGVGLVLLGTRPVLAEEQKQVLLAESFKIARKGGSKVTHVPAILFTRDGKRLISGTSDGHIYVWDAGKKEVLDKVHYTDEAINALDVDRDGLFAVWARAKGGIRVMDLKKKEVVHKEDGKTAQWVAIAPDGKTVAVAFGAAVELRALPSLTKVASFTDHKAAVSQVAWRGDGKAFASAGRDGKLVVRAFPGDEILRETVNKGQLYAVAFRPGTTHLAYGGHNRVIHQLDVAEGKETLLKAGQPYWITALGYSPDGTHIAVGDESCDVWIYEVDTKKLLFHSKHHVECWLSSVAWADDGERFLFGCRPNSHAGKPALYMPNVQAEAHHDKKVQAFNGKLRENGKRLRDRVGSASMKSLLDEAEALIRRRNEAVAKALEKLGKKKEAEAWRKKSARAEAVEAVAGAVKTKAADQLKAPAMNSSADVGVSGAASGGFQSLGSEPSIKVKQTGKPSLPPGASKEVAELNRQIAELQKKVEADEEVKKLRAEQASLIQGQKKELGEAVKRLSQSFNINEWRLKKKKK
ncbi:MAG: WD40 repeat domain-containing protein [Planctomycetota bacterium]|jgi:WD40 repeat protein